MFAIVYMSCLALGVPFNFTQHDMPAYRLRIAYEILTETMLPPVVGIEHDVVVDEEEEEGLNGVM